jgi:hypothetical protein
MENLSLKPFYAQILPLHLSKFSPGFRLRWQVEVTFEEVRAHLGVETQRQWLDKAIARTTPAWFTLFSIVALFAHELLPQRQWHLR